MNPTAMVGTTHGNRVSSLLFTIGIAALTAFFGGCGDTDFSETASNTGRLTLYADEAYGPLIRTLADTFMLNNPKARIEVRTLGARQSIQELLNTLTTFNPSVDSITTAVVMARPLLDDERAAIDKAQKESNGDIDLKEYKLAYDGLGIVVPRENTMRYVVREGVMRAIGSAHPTLGMLDSSTNSTPFTFVSTDGNSSIYQLARLRLAGGKTPAAPFYSYTTSDSVIEAVAAGKGIGLMGWWRARRDSARVRVLPMSYVDSIGVLRPATISHPITLAGNTYPVKVPLIGYTFAPLRSLGVGFLVWLERNMQAEQYFTYKALIQPANAKIRVSLPENEQ